MAETSYYVQRGDKKFGPYKKSQLHSAAMSGRVRPNDIILYGEKSLKASDVKGLLPDENPTPAKPPARPKNAGHNSGSDTESAHVPNREIEKSQVFIVENSASSMTHRARRKRKPQRGIWIAGLLILGIACITTYYCFAFIFPTSPFKSESMQVLRWYTTSRVPKPGSSPGPFGKFHSLTDDNGDPAILAVVDFSVPSKMLGIGPDNTELDFTLEDISFTLPVEDNIVHGRAAGARQVAIGIPVEHATLNQFDGFFLSLVASVWRSEGKEPDYSEPVVFSVFFPVPHSDLSKLRLDFRGLASATLPPSKKIEDPNRSFYKSEAILRSIEAATRVPPHVTRGQP